MFGEVNPGFFQRLANRRVLERGVFRLAASAGQRDLAAPGIAFSIGSLDEQDFESVTRDW